MPLHHGLNVGYNAHIENLSDLYNIEDWTSPISDGILAVLEQVKGNDVHSHLTVIYNKFSWAYQICPELIPTPEELCSWYAGMPKTWI